MKYNCFKTENIIYLHIWQTTKCMGIALNGCMPTAHVRLHN